MVAITLQNEGDEHPRVIDAKISPPIFVDSRKSARETQITKADVKVNSFYDLFPPEIFDKQLVKRKNTDKEQVSEEISNDITGFTNYFTAPNIRNKVISQSIIFHYQLIFFLRSGEASFLPRIQVFAVCEDLL